MDDFVKRADELRNRSRARNTVTHTQFLTPAQSFEIRRIWPDTFFSGGGEENERLMAFFLPDYMEPEYFQADEYISCVMARARFSNLSHRDYLGAVLGLGITREAVGDVLVFDDRAYIYCLPAAAEFACLNLDKVGRYGTNTVIVPLTDVPKREKNVKEVKFSVMSPRLDAVLAGVFGLPRTAAAKFIENGLVSVNYAEAAKPDMMIKENDIISARGSGKAKVASIGGMSRRGRIFVTAEIYE